MAVHLKKQKSRIILGDLKRILIIFWGRIGETIPATVLLEVFSKFYPKAYITCLVSGDGVRLLENHPKVNELIEPDISIFRKIMLNDPYDLAIDLHYKKLSRKITWLSGAKHHIWYESSDGLYVPSEPDNIDLNNITKKEKILLNDCYVFNKQAARYIQKRRINHKQKLELDRLFRYKMNGSHLRGVYYKNKFNNKLSESVIIKLPRGPTVIDKMLSVPKALGLNTVNIRMPKLYLSKSEVNFANKYIQTIKSKKNLIIGFHPGGHLKLKLWPEENYAALADKLIEEFKATILIFQGQREKKTAEKVNCLISNKSIVVPELDIRKYMALISQCDIFVTTDGGPMHIAPALGTAVVGIFMYGDAHYWFPYEIKDGHISISSKKALYPKLSKAYREGDKTFIRNLIPVDKVFKTIKKILSSLPYRQSNRFEL